MGRARARAIDRVVVSPVRVDADAYWEFSSKVSRGAVYHYSVLDSNDSLPRPWWFVLHVPADMKKGAYVLLQALDFPRKRAWTPLARTVINFAKATIQPHRGRLYAKVRLADPMGSQKYENLAWEHHRALPSWFGGFELRPKKKVATTRGSDGNALVAVVPKDDHTQMIRLFFATKVWPLDAGLPAATRKAIGRGVRG